MTERNCRKTSRGPVFCCIFLSYLVSYADVHYDFIFANRNFRRWDNFPASLTQTQSVAAVNRIRPAGFIKADNFTEFDSQFLFEFFSFFVCVLNRFCSRFGLHRGRIFGRETETALLICSGLPHITQNFSNFGGVSNFYIQILRNRVPDNFWNSRCCAIERRRNKRITPIIVLWRNIITRSFYVFFINAICFERSHDFVNILRSFFLRRSNGGCFRNNAQIYLSYIRLHKNLSLPYDRYGRAVQLWRGDVLNNLPRFNRKKYRQKCANR